MSGIPRSIRWDDSVPVKAAWFDGPCEHTPSFIILSDVDDTDDLFGILVSQS